ncbi:DUF423 domain-containing protein [Aliidiomarina sedimenti]|uniref:DUF423 domain-containing protein n=1 Tax=Aliidiomarina sedimenti TaxID=1933879 RepID=A0ABY0C307_9GAMM|nr:DUF423 domain-containing protein [Aliidiomarina sedimenti]RUO32059.1 DUF423 domain-containing protein [Aliidiomarina sedimenti]
MSQIFIVLAGLLGALSVALGAFAAHGLQASLSERSLEVFKTAVHYQFMHAIALLVLGVWLSQQALGNWGTAVGVSWLIGILLFSGSLYWLSLGGPRWLGPVTPLGGLSFIIGWLLLAVAAWRVAGSATNSG